MLVLSYFCFGTDACGGLLLLNLLNKLLNLLGLIFLPSQKTRHSAILTFFRPNVLSAATFDPVALGCSFFFGGMARPTVA
jgi:hypothetical protein